jgi:hypothetical protein
MCHLTLQNIFERTKLLERGYFCGCAQKYSSRCSGEPIFADYLCAEMACCGGENRFPAAWHNHAVQYNLHRSPASMFFAGGRVSAKPGYFLQTAVVSAELSVFFAKRQL